MGTMMSFGKIGARRTARILPYDAEVEYLESTGTQYIDTGVVPTTTTETNARMMITTNPSSLSVFCGTDIVGNVAATYALIWFEVTPSATYKCMVNFLNSISFSPTIGSWFDITMNQTQTRNLILNETIIGTFTGQISFPSSKKKSMYIFARNSDSGTLPFPGVRLGRLSIHDGGICLRDFIPVRFTNEQGVSEGAMFDRANPTVGMDPDGSARTDGLYRNRGTGAFLCGNDL